MLIYLDACAIIEAREKSTDAGQALANLMIDAFEIGTVLCTSELSLLEVLVGPLKGINSTDEETTIESHALHDWYVRNLIPTGRFIKTLAIDTDALKMAARLRAQTRSLKSPDAVHVAAAQLAGCSHFVTGDDRLANAIAHHRTITADAQFETVLLDAAHLSALANQLPR